MGVEFGNIFMRPARIGQSCAKYAQLSAFASGMMVETPKPLASSISIWWKNASLNLTFTPCVTFGC
jgi:hypothetical protein